MSAGSTKGGSSADGAGSLAPAAAGGRAAVVGAGALGVAAGLAEGGGCRIAGGASMAAGLLDGSAGGGFAAVAIDAAGWGWPELRSVAAEIAATLPRSHSG